MKKKRQYASPKRRLQPGDATKVFGHGANEIRRGDRIYVISRVSGWEQKRRGNDNNQLAGLIKNVERLGANVVGTHTEVASGADPIWLVPVLDEIRRLNAIAVFESTGRAIRHPAYDKEQQWPQARDIELNEVASYANGLTLMTWLHPNATPKEVRSYEIETRAKREREAGRTP